LAFYRALYDEPVQFGCHFAIRNFTQRHFPIYEQKIVYTFENGEVMIRHILLFSLKESVPKDVQQDMLNDLAAFPERFPEIQSWQMGANVSNRDSVYEYGVTMTFEHQEALMVYLSSEEHERFVSERFRPIISARAIVTFEVD
jgi:Stress responsive A/B Barrel Domain